MFSRMVLLAAAVLGLGAAAEAAVLTTPLLLVDYPAFMSCLISNVSDRDTTVRIEVLSYSGAQLADSGTITLGAGQTDGQSAYESARCKFTVGSTNLVRALGTVNDAGVGSTSSVEAR